MADTTKIIQIEVDLKTGAVTQLGTEIEKVSKKTKDAQKGVQGIATSFKKVGLEIKAAGIGLILAAFATLKKLFGENQLVLDAFETAITAVKIAINDLFKFVEKNAGTVQDFFKSIFEDPIGSIKEFGNVIQEYIIKYVKQAIEGFGLLGESIGYLIDGDFSKALDVATDGVTKLGSAALHLNPLTAVATNLVETIVENKDAIADYITDTIKTADALTQQAKAMEFSEINSRKLQLAYQKQAEDLRQIRDDETRSVADRIKANEELGKVLMEAIEAEKAEVQTRINFLELQNNKLGENQERLKEIKSLRVEQLDIEERIGGVMSEQLVNQNSLLREQSDAIKELDAISADETQTRIIELEQLYDERTRLANLFVEDEVERKRYLQEIELSHQAEIAKIEADALAKLEAARKEKEAKELEDAKKLREAKQSIADQSFQAATAINDALLANGLITAKKAFQIQKSVSIGEAITNGILAVQKTLKEPAYPAPFNLIAAGLMGATTAANVARIAASKFDAGGSTSSGSTGQAPTISGNGAPQFNTVGASGINQLSQSIANQNKQPVQAYVVANDISTAQGLERSKVQQASFP